MTRTLLIIDDNKSVRESLRFLLLRRGYAVFVAENGREGIELAKQTRVDGALIDVNMPGINGVEVCRQLTAHAHATGKKLPIWMMTGARTPELNRQAIEAGALVLLGKPFDFGELFRRLDEELGVQEPPQPAPDVLDQL